MKIKAIRGKNLASLAGEFAVDFEAQPLGGVGLFAITGPTGAGKSTILDAICLALFGKTPRLSGRSSVKIRSVGAGEGDDGVSEQDARSILRHGCAEGFAEVDFAGIDGHEYRARWLVRRAGRGGKMRLQNIAIGLTDLTSGDAVGGKTNSETFDEVERRLGLSFAQFTRSVLLAQGEFAAFLKAGGKDRSELLQAITGSDIYKRISAGAFERAKVEREALARIEERIAQCLPLDPQARAALEQAIRDEEQQVKTGEARLEKIKADLAWHAALADLSGKEAAAKTEMTAAETAERDSVPRKAHLEQVRLAQGARDLVGSLDRAAGELAAVGVKLQENAVAREEHRVLLERLGNELVQAKAREEACEREREAAASVVNEARLLDGAVVSQKHVTTVAEERIGAQRKAAAAARLVLVETATRKEALEKAIAETASWLEKNAWLVPVATDWALVNAELHRFLQEAEIARNESEQANRLRGEIAENKTSLEAGEARRKSLTEETAVAEKAVGELETLAAGFNLEAIGAEAEENRRIERVLEKLSDQREKAAELCGKRDEILDELADNGAQAAKQAANLDEAKASGETLATELAALELQEREMIALRSSDVASLREHLQDGKPCPVCGSESHPWRDRAPVSDEALKQLTARVKELRRQVEAGAASLAEAQGALKALDKEKKKLAKQLGENDAAIEGVRADWGNARALEEREGSAEDAGIMGLPADPFVEKLRKEAAVGQPLENEGEQPLRFTVAKGLEKKLAGLREIAESVSRQLKSREKEAHSLRRKLDKAHEGLRKLAVESQALDQTIGEARLSLAAKEQALKACVEKIAAAEKVRGEIKTRLALTFAGRSTWEGHLERDAKRFLRDTQRQVEEFRDLKGKGEKAEKELGELAPVFARLEAEAAAAENALQKEEAVLREEVAKLAGLVARRSTLLGNKPVEEFENELKQRFADARAAVETAQKALNEGERSAAELRLAAEHLAANQEKYKKEFGEYEREMAGRLAEMGTDLETLRSRLALSPDWIAGEAAALEAVAVRCVQARTKLDTCVQDLERHRSGAAGPVPKATKEALEAEMPVVLADLKTRGENLGTLRGQIAVDDERRLILGREIVKREAQMKITKLWEELNGLIGSSDGSKFNRFAQNITFDVLLVYANRHLDELSRRYRLQRVPGTDLELQLIDRELGDEVRGIYSLSGGESFIVALALALGLASLSSERTLVESLFIDEGFGTLDTETLDLVLAGLDSLQAGGRKIGIISHVKTLIERIGVQVEVAPKGNGCSAVRVLSAGG